MLREISILDLEQIELLEKNAFTLGAWSREMLRGSITATNCYKVCYEEGGKILGYLLANYNSWDAEILTIAVDDGYKRRGVATKMLGALKDFCINKKIERLFLEVRRSNEGAINLYLKFGFKPISIRKNYYENTEDAIIMELDFGT